MTISETIDGRISILNSGRSIMLSKSQAYSLFDEMTSSPQVTRGQQPLTTSIATGTRTFTEAEMSKKQKESEFGLPVDFTVTGKDAEELANSKDPEAWLKGYIRKKYGLPIDAEIDLSQLHIEAAEEEIS